MYFLKFCKLRHVYCLQTLVLNLIIKPREVAFKVVSRYWKTVVSIEYADVFAVGVAASIPKTISNVLYLAVSFNTIDVRQTQFSLFYLIKSTTLTVISQVSCSLHGAIVTTKSITSFTA